MIHHLLPFIDLPEREGIQWDTLAEEIGLVLPGQVKDPDDSSIVHGVPTHWISPDGPCLLSRAEKCFQPSRAHRVQPYGTAGNREPLPVNRCLGPKWQL